MTLLLALSTPASADCAAGMRTVTSGALIGGFGCVPEDAERFIFTEGDAVTACPLDIPSSRRRCYPQGQHCTRVYSITPQTQYVGQLRVVIGFKANNRRAGVSAWQSVSDHLDP